MTDFISTDHGYVNVASITRLVTKVDPKMPSPSGGLVTRTRVFYTDEQGESEETWTHMEPEQIGGVIIPAASGFYLIGAWRDEKTGEVGYWKTPILAWRVHGGWTYPVCVGDEGSASSVILSPEGLVIVPGMQTFDSVDAFLKDQFQPLVPKE